MDLLFEPHSIEYDPIIGCLATKPTKSQIIKYNQLSFATYKLIPKTSTIRDFPPPLISRNELANVCHITISSLYWYIIPWGICRKRGILIPIFLAHTNSAFRKRAWWGVPALLHTASVTITSSVPVTTSEPNNIFFKVFERFQMLQIILIY